MPWRRIDVHKPNIFVILLIIAVMGAAIFTSMAAARHEILNNNQVLGWLFLPDVVFPILALGIIAVFSYLGVSRKVSSLINETMDSAISGIIHFDGKGNMTRCNPAAVYMIPEIVESEESENYIGSYKKFLVFVYDHSLDIQDQSRISLEINHEENSSRFLFREVVSLKNKKVALIQFYQRSSSEILAIITDISLMKRHIDEVAALTDENKMMLKALEAANTAMMIADVSDPEEPIQYINKSFLNILGIEQQNLPDNSLSSFLSAQFSGDQIEAIRHAVLIARQERAAQNIWLTRKDKKQNVAWYSLHILLFEDTNGKEFIVIFLSDQTQMRLKEAQLHQSKKLEAIAQMAGCVAHDFNNVLSVIDGYSKMLERNIQNNGDNSSHYFEQIKTSVKRGVNLTNRLLTFGQCRATQKIRLDICDQVRDLEAFLAPLANNAINFILSIQDEACYVDSAPDSITQIVMNLVSNSREAMPQGGDLIVSVTEATRPQLLSFGRPFDPYQRYACLQVIDSGKGFDAELSGRVLEPFFTTKDPHKHQGLGLSIVYGLVKEIGGELDIKSTLGIGTSITVLIPLQEKLSKDFAFKNFKPRDLTVLEGKTILVVEDRYEILELQCDRLESLGLKILGAGSGNEALEIQLKHGTDIDYILIDIGLPDIDGIDLAERFSALLPKANLMLMSGAPLKNDILYPLLIKPFSCEQLEEQLLKISVLEEQYAGQ